MSFTCNICNKNYKSMSGLWKHMLIHKDTIGNSNVNQSDHLETKKCSRRKHSNS